MIGKKLLKCNAKRVKIETYSCFAVSYNVLAKKDVLVLCHVITSGYNIHSSLLENGDRLSRQKLQVYTLQHHTTQYDVHCTLLYYVRECVLPW